MTVIGKRETRWVATDDDRQFNVRRDDSSRWLRLSNCQHREHSRDQSAVKYCTTQSPIHVTCYQKFVRAPKLAQSAWCIIALFSTYHC